MASLFGKAPRVTRRRKKKALSVIGKNSKWIRWLTADEANALRSIADPDKSFELRVGSKFKTVNVGSEMKKQSVLAMHERVLKHLFVIARDARLGRAPFSNETRLLLLSAEKKIAEELNRRQNSK